MKQKYYMTNRKGEDQVIHKSYVDSKNIYQQLSPSMQDKELALKGMHIVERKINLSINFDYDSSSLSQAGRRQAEALGAASEKLLRENPDGKIEITGYTDTHGSASYNQKLSEKRAATIKALLLDHYGIRYSQIKYSGRGERSPVCLDGNGYDELGGEYSCRGIEDEEASRRVEVKFKL